MNSARSVEVVVGLSALLVMAENMLLQIDLVIVVMEELSAHVVMAEDV